MSIVMQPAAYLLGTVTGTLTLHPASYVLAIPNGRMVLRPAMFVTCIEETPKIKVKADTRRNLPARVEADTKRTLLTKVEADTERKVITPVAKLTLDTARTLVNDRIHDVAIALDTRRDIDIVHIDFDATRTLIQNVKAVHDTYRRVSVPVTVVCRTHRVLQNRVAIAADTKRCIPYRLPAQDANHPLEPFRALGIRSFSFTLGELTLSDTFQLENIQPLAIGDAVEGQLMDYHFHFLVEETSQRDLVQSVKGMYDRDALLYTPICICVDEALVSYYVQEIAAAMDWQVDMNCDDFIPSQNYENSGMTYQDFISSLFGWTSRLPHRQINVFLRGDTLHIIQRGQEQSVIDITDWPHSRPTIERRLVRSVWSSGNNDNLNNRAHNEAEDEPVPFTGTISFQDISRHYVDGYLVDEETQQGYTHYAYIDGYLTTKQTHNVDGSTSTTEYSYAATENDRYLFSEKEHATDPIDDGRKHDHYDWQDWENENFTERVTYHAPLGGGWYGTTVYEDGELVGSSLAQGKTGGKASQYTINQSNLGLGGRYKNHDDGQNWTPIGSSEFPVKGEDYLLFLTKEIWWLDRKTQETITLDVTANVRHGVPDVSHIVDFTERIRFAGNEYFLVSNTVELTPRSLRQTIEMTRWY
ncbi:MAG: hypothetical protein SPL39_07595 [Selenomonadaceae bacterium]|nr:hypothetical protein [Selenomonadaceae bacterium]